MATSIQIVGNKVEHFRDLDLIALICFMSDAVQQDPEAFSVIAPVVDSWNGALVDYGPGAIELGLDGVASSRQLTQELDLLLSRVAARITGFGPTIPSSFLNHRCQVPGVTFAEYSGVLLLQALEKLRNLLSPC